jgi:hypothetical protein
VFAHGACLHLDPQAALGCAGIRPGFAIVMAALSMRSPSASSRVLWSSFLRSSARTMSTARSLDDIPRPSPVPLSAPGLGRTPTWSGFPHPSATRHRTKALGRCRGRPFGGPRMDRFAFADLRPVCAPRRARHGEVGPTRIPRPPRGRPQGVAFCASSSPAAICTPPTCGYARFGNESCLPLPA